MKNKIRILISLIAIILLVLIIRSTYSKYVNQAVGSLMTRVGEWVIRVNGQDITLADAPANIVIDSDDFVWNWTDVQHVKKPKVAPGMIGSFELEIDPTDTQVSFEYDISIKNPVIQIPGQDDLEIKLAIKNIVETHGRTIEIKEVDGNQLIHRIKPLGEIEEAATAVDTIRVTVEWLDDGTNDEADRIAGSVPDNVIEMPILIHAIQYTGGI
ncbi:MAG: hypothetical protein IKJ36_03335 [Clostridia bacterium]|nr:hypothetical protein [Clostridia bacterium]